MKKKMVENTIPICIKKTGWWITVQQEKNILILNIFYNKVLKCRHCINADTYEYATLLKNGVWVNRILSEALGLDRMYYGYSEGDRDIKERFRMLEEDAELIKSVLKADKWAGWYRSAYGTIERREREYNSAKAERREANRIMRVNEIMGKIPPLPSGIMEWIDRQETGGADYLIRSRENGTWGCSYCGERSEEKALKRVDGGKKIRHNDRIICPYCSKEVRAIKRKKTIDILTHFALVQPVDDEIGVVRYFDAVIYSDGCKKAIGLDEAVRIILFKNDLQRSCSIYYNQFKRGWGWAVEKKAYYPAPFDDKGNRANRRESPGYLYDAGIEEAFKGTRYQNWARLFVQMSAAGLKLDYNRLMCTKNDSNFMHLTELLFKGRFYRLLAETSKRISVWNGEYVGMMKLVGSGIEDAFGIDDRQKINRIRDKNGGECMVEWMRWAERHRPKISDKVLEWLLENNLTYANMQWLNVRMSLEQAMNYIERQRKESYKGKKAAQVISQYEDYMDMCNKLHRQIDDEMVYRPRDLKRRHDEAVKEIELRRAKLDAEKYSIKFGEAEKVLQEIKDKFEYTGERYMILVPEKIVDIVKEGRALHHCAGATDRYFDRIKQHETYICFLRKTKEPETPYYTIEVEPGGTIRQHRGMYDEEPEIEQVKPFLREWQQTIRKRMKKKDHDLAAVSKEKREANLEELRAKNNIRVLQGLMEDFMEAM